MYLIVLGIGFCGWAGGSQGLRAIAKPAPSPGTHQTPVETLSESVGAGTTGIWGHREGAKGRQQKGETGPGTHIFTDFRRFSARSVDQGIWESQMCAENHRESGKKKAHKLGGVLRGNTIRGNRPERF